MAEGRLDDAGVEERLVRLDELLDRIEQVPGPTVDAAMEAVRTLTEVYGEGLARVIALADPVLVERMHDDELLAHLLVLHDLDPDPVERRVQRAVAALRPAIESRGGQLELEAVEDGVARVRLSGGGCGSSASGLEQAVRDSVLGLAPELVRVEPVAGGAVQALIPVDALLRRPATVAGPG